MPVRALAFVLSPGRPLPWSNLFGKVGVGLFMEAVKHLSNEGLSWAVRFRKRSESGDLGVSSFP